MKEPQIPENEKERLAELYDFDILDTETEKDFDEIVQLASLICETPISLISLIDKDRQWFKAQVGLDTKEIDRNFAFCAYAIHDSKLMEVIDATTDDRFSDNPMVVGDPGIRFYAGMPLITSSGQAMGTLCVIDNKTKTLDDSQKFCLNILAKQVVRQMEFRKLTHKLKTSDGRNNIFVQQAPNALAMFDKKMRYIAASQKWLEDYNLKGRDIIGVSHYEIFPEIGEDWKKIHRECLNGAINKQEEAYFERADGSGQWITWDVRPWYISGGNIGGLLMYTADVTAMKEKEQENRRIKDILDKTNAVARIGTWEVNFQTGQVEWSKVTREIHEVSANYTPPLEEAIHFFREGKNRESILNKFNDAVTNGAPYDLELELITAKGNEVWVRSIGQAEFENGKCKRLYGVFQDITDRKKAEAAMIEAKNLAEQSALLKETFLANMSHEIRTPMNAIIGFAELLLKKNLGIEERDYIRIVKNSGENLLRIINDILDISKINSGMMAFEEHPLSIRELFLSLKAMISQTANEKNLTLSFVSDTTIPDTLLGDATRLTQILLNLIGNAVKFTKKGEVKVHAKILREDLKVCELEISVTDTGIGIPDNKLEYIFERFSQAESHTTRSYGGTGLGLSIAKQLIELQDGSIRIKSRQGSGTEVSFVLPLKKTQRHWILTTPTEDTGFSNSLAPLTVLLVDDNPINLKLLIGLFSSLGTKIITAENGRIAIEILKKGSVDLVLLDIEMPEMNGYETTTYIRHKMNSKVPIIAMTANAMSGENEKCIQLGMNDYISKPIKAEILFEKILHSVPKKCSEATDRVIQLAFLHKSMGSNQELLLEILNMFLEMVPEDVEAIIKAIESCNYDLIRKRSHKLLSTVLALGATGMETVLKEMELLGKEARDHERITELGRQLEMLCKKAILEVEQERNLLLKSHEQ